MVQDVAQEVRGEWWWEAERNRSSRLDYLRKTLWSKAPTAGDFPAGVKCGLDKIYWFTKVFRETEGLPWVMRRAYALAATLENMPVFIRDQSQFVGYPGGKPNEVSLMMEESHMVNDDVYYDKGKIIDDEDKPWVKKALAYWKPLSFQSQMERYVSQELQLASKISIHVISFCWTGVVSSSNMDYEYMFEHGLNGIVETMEKNIIEARRILETGPAAAEKPNLIPKIDQWTAMKIAAEGMITWAERHSRLARIIAENFEPDTKRRSELLKMADICEKIPAEPPEHFQEAMQFWLFVGSISKFMERVHTGWGFRADQIWWPHYKKDVIDDKYLTRDEALELMGDLQTRVYEISAIFMRGGREYVTGQSGILYILTLGGVLEDGRDACNDLTDLILEAARLTRLGTPTYVFRFHPRSRTQTLRQVFETIRHGLGYPSLQHDAVCIDTLMHNYGATLQEARSWANVVCMSPCPTRGRGGQGMRYASMLAASKCLELALHDGFDPLVTKMQLGPHTGDVAKFATFEKFWEAWRNQLSWAIDSLCNLRNMARFLEGKYLQQPLMSCSWQRCVDSGIDCVDPQSGEVPNPWMTVVVWNDTGDSLYAIKKLVFDEKKYTMEQLVKALEANWIGYEEMRLDFAGVPKWGNDIEGVDNLVVDATKALAEECAENQECGGARYMPLPENGSGFMVFASRLGALPNGRSLGDPCYDGGISPAPGMDRKGPTAVLRSCSKLDTRSLKQALLNQRLTPSQMAGEKGFQLWLNYIKTWYDMDIPHIQFNCVDSETLRAAQAEPEKYNELIVRVAGYSAHFVEMNRATQDAVIARTVQEM